MMTDAVYLAQYVYDESTGHTTFSMSPRNQEYNVTIHEQIRADKGVAEGPGRGLRRMRGET